MPIYIGDKKASPSGISKVFVGNKLVYTKKKPFTFTKLDVTFPISIDSDATIESLGTDIYIFHPKQTNDKVYKFNTLTNEVTTISTNIPQYYHRSSCIYENKIYLVGGNVDSFSSERTNKMHTFNGSSITEVNYPIPIAVMNPAVVGIIGNMYCVGGYTDSSVSKNFARRSTGSWNTVFNSSLVQGVFSAYGFTAPYIYFLGGNPTAESFSNRIIRYDVRSTSPAIKMAINLPSNLSQSAFGVIDTDIYLIGGKVNSSLYSRKIYKFDMVEEKISVVANLSIDLNCFGKTFATVANSIYIFNGQDIYKFTKEAE